MANPEKNYGPAWFADQVEILPDLGRAYGFCMDDECEALYRIDEANRRLRPSIIVSMAKCTKGSREFIDSLGHAIMATYYPEKADAFAGEACEAFPADRAQDADNVYNLVILAGAQAANPDEEWQHISALTRRLIKKMEGDQ